MSDGDVVHEIKPGETYQLDSDEFNSEEEPDGLETEEYDDLVDEGAFVPLLCTHDVQQRTDMPRMR